MKKEPNRISLHEIRTKKQKIKSIRLAGIKKHRNYTKRVKRSRRARLQRSYIGNVKSTEKNIQAPETFALTSAESRDELIHFLKRTDDYLKSGHKINICFDQTKLLNPCGTLWATAKLEKLIKQYPNRISCTYPTDNTVEQLFQHIGLLQKLGKNEIRTEINADNVKHWHYVNGNSTDDVALFKELLQSIYLNEEARSGLFDSMSEAVTNTIQHAYPSNLKKEWYMFAQLRNNKLTIVICDQGIGIPSSLREKPELKEFLYSPIHKAKRQRDTKLIQIAVESSRTSTKLKHRGKGLKEMLELVKSGVVGGFLILSGKGCYIYNAKTEQHNRIDYKTNIHGTIIEWQISLDSRHEQ